jgi:hypothetical protein
MGCFSPDAPDARNYAAETESTLSAQINMMPYMLEAQQKYGPQQTQIGLQNVEQYLSGTDGQRGLLSMYQQDIAPTLSDVEAQTRATQRGADIRDVAQLGPQAYEAMRGFNPQQTGLMDVINANAQQQMALGGQMTPEQRMAIENQALGRASSQGWGYNPGDLAEAARQATGYSDQLQQARQQYGSQVAALNQGVYGDPFAQVLGRPGQTFSAMQGVGQQGILNATQNPFNPESSYAGNIYNANQGYEAMFADPSTLSKIGKVTNAATFGLLGEGGSY